MLNSNQVSFIMLSLVMLLVTCPLQTGTIIQGIVVKSVNRDYSKSSWDGYEWSSYTGLAVTQVTTAIISWFVPSLVKAITCKWTLVLSGFLFCLSFTVFIFPFKYGLILASLMMGIANSAIWPAQGNYLALITNETNTVKYTGLLWTIMNVTLVVGNLIVIRLFNGKESINSNLRTTTYASLIAIGLVGVVLSLFLKNVPLQEEADPKSISVFEGIYSAIKFMAHKKMILVAILAVFIGLELSFFTGLYSTSIAYTLDFGIDRKKYSGESGLLMGLGEMTAGIVFAASSNRKRSGLVVLFSYLLYLITVALIFINLPFSSSLYETSEHAIVDSSIYLALICALLLGLCDGLYETQVFEFIVRVYGEESSAPFAIIGCLQSVGGSVLFCLSNYIGLQVHIIILSVTATIGTLSFCIANRMVKRKERKAIQVRTIAYS